MKALKYKTLITDSDLHNIHGFKYTISEIFVPEASLAFNEKGGLFVTKLARGRGKEVVEIANSDVDVLKRFLIDKQACAEIIKKHYPKCEKLLQYVNF